MADVQNRNNMSSDGEKYPVLMRLASIKQLTHLEGKHIVFGGECTAFGRTGATEATAFRNPSNQRNPASPASWANSRARIASKSRFALVVVLTWKGTLYAQFLKRLLGGLGAPGLQVLVALPDAFDSFLIFLPLPFQILGQGVIKRGGSVLATTLRVLF
jgi:hypothetical protein